MRRRASFRNGFNWPLVTRGLSDDDTGGAWWHCAPMTWSRQFTLRSVNRKGHLRRSVTYFYQVRGTVSPHIFPILKTDGQFWNPLKDCALGSLFVMNETLEKSFESSKFDQNRMQKRIGLNMAAFGADSILWATCELYKKNKDKFDDERMVSSVNFVTKFGNK